MSGGIEGGNAGITVANSVVGHLYQLQYSDGLAEDSWIDHAFPQAGTGSEVLFVVPVDALAPRRFYGVLIQS